MLRGNVGEKIAGRWYEPQNDRLSFEILSPRNDRETLPVITQAYDCADKT